jgi:hypothetical protein
MQNQPRSLGSVALEIVITSIASVSQPHRFLGRVVAFERIIDIYVVNLFCNSADRSNKSAAYTKVVYRKEDNTCLPPIERGAAHK